MHRCLELAKLGAGHVAPNPMVGAVLVHEGRIIGEGWHKEYGEAHAEVNCINAVQEEDRQFISQSILYVSLEPCAHHGKTPPCADLIIRHKIPKVVIGCRDPFKEVDGKGIEKLKSAGIEVETAVLEEECRELNKRFFTFHKKQRSFIILKWAQTADGFIAGDDSKRILISNEFSNRLVHKWRSEEAAIMVGTNTALRDDPALTTRLWPGPSPVRLVIDMNLRLPGSLKVFDGSERTIVFNTIKEDEKPNLSFIKLDKEKQFVPQLMDVLYRLPLQSVLVEGGAALLQTFIESGVWDEARVIVNGELSIGNGLPAPVLKNEQLVMEEKNSTDTISYFRNSK
ncbi:MAG: bifunctional diaminohydroxyphosphoribosylaminopyrimidine deaminase/5-amino-6-(5-phosphoribosylamino)uracil reductase RibD [Chitinophagaceae bacterium]|nr:bifunctional diaminohydroxyphosphoribosylaminopyrimidine deaminase/5-amino-6-(5-phosphoribosylamino)uracil reductase RibD [Chitinophagaceae bacterium]